LGTRKIKRKKTESERTEEMRTMLDRTAIWVRERINVILGVAAGVLVIALAVWGLRLYGDLQEQWAGEAYAEAMRVYPGIEATDPQAWNRVIEELGKMVEKHSGTEAALSARLTLANACYRADRPEEALEHLQEAERRIGRDHKLAGMVDYQLGIVYQVLDRPDEALDEWKDLLARGNPKLEREIHWHMARIYERKGEYGKAREQYKQALETPGRYPDALLLEHALDRTARKAPVAAGEKTSSRVEADVSAEEAGFSG
jgi:predicted negative regulator of RcsB-dependent stress response